MFFQGGSLFLYNYNKLGRLSSVILPTGEVLDLSSKISLDNDHLELGMSSPLHGADENNEKKPFSLDVRTSNNDFKKYSLTRGTEFSDPSDIAYSRRFLNCVLAVQVHRRAISSVTITDRSFFIRAGMRIFDVWPKRNIRYCSYRYPRKQKCYLS